MGRPAAVGRQAWPAPDYDSPHWRGTPTAKARPGTRTKANQWLFGYEFLNGPLDDRGPAQPGQAAGARPAGHALRSAPWPWSWPDLRLVPRVVGPYRGALLSLFLACLSPTLLAHARLVTTDLPSALGFSRGAVEFLAFLLAVPRGRGPLVVAVCLAGGAAGQVLGAAAPADAGACSD